MDKGNFYKTFEAGFYKDDICAVPTVARGIGAENAKAVLSKALGVSSFSGTPQSLPGQPVRSFQSPSSLPKIQGSGGVQNPAKPATTARTPVAASPARRVPGMGGGMAKGQLLTPSLLSLYDMEKADFAEGPGDTDLDRIMPKVNPAILKQSKVQPAKVTQNLSTGYPNDISLMTDTPQRPVPGTMVGTGSTHTKGYATKVAGPPEKIRNWKGQTLYKYPAGSAKVVDRTKPLGSNMPVPHSQVGKSFLTPSLFDLYKMESPTPSVPKVAEFHGLAQQIPGRPNVAAVGRLAGDAPGVQRPMSSRPQRPPQFKPTSITRGVPAGPPQIASAKGVPAYVWPK